VERHAEEPARVVSIQDGDTITVTTRGRTEKVRLVGIDTPELHDERPEYREAAKAARDFARTRLAAESVLLQRDSSQGDRDKYGRLLRYVILADQTNVNEELVCKGYARVYDRFSFSLKPQFKRCEAEAKEQRLGLWSLPPGKARQTPAAAMSETQPVGLKTMSKDHSVRFMFIVVLAIVLWSAFRVLAPFAAGFTWAAVLVATFRPFHDYLERVFRGRRWMASSAVTILVAAFVVVPIVMAAIQAVEEASRRIDGPSRATRPAARTWG
jgi:endonuclease YncB( thermonuclease family)